jgi:4-oxalocrotonate tautomerase
VPTIFFYGLELEKEKKQELIKSFTQTASHLTGLPENAFVVYLQAVETENVGVGGELLSEKRKK